MEILAGAGVLIVLALAGLAAVIKLAGGKEKHRERADRLAENAERRARAERVAAEPVDPRRIRALWDRYRRRVSDSEGG